MLHGKKVVLGVTGGIAAYKAVELAGRLKKQGAEVHVILTEGAKNFVTELTFREITGQPVTSTMWGEVANFQVEHIALARLADFVIVAPATANFIAKAAHGMADDMLTTTLLATRAPVYFAPAMNTAMYENPITQENIERLIQQGWRMIEPETGMLACGTIGAGRLPEPEDIVQALIETEGVQETLAGKRFLVTAGGTLEAVDPVRFLGNRSSGKMGYAIAEEAARRGAFVTLVFGATVALPAPDSPLVTTVRVESAQDMREAVLKASEGADVIIKAAAVADYRVKEIAADKIKKNDEVLTLELVKNPDILKELGEKKRAGQILVGFAAETQNLLDYASDKLRKKNLDLLVANDVSRKDAGFASDYNEVKLLYADGRIEDISLQPKSKIARILLDRIEDLCAAAPVPF
ncbi:bifunctional phosphopantothenoylcysteine decarboxylase/phosphopantothenate--cysteine ligase CoaBC [Selenomonas sp. TAMA-11512]|nr:bifunctional phosphopantothenoylcysteine decarboxylase/phosphopantothenate--cysteine ligase CoaBC [Selenomonas sp. TAMA-11512]